MGVVVRVGTVATRQGAGAELPIRVRRSAQEQTRVIQCSNSGFGSQWVPAERGRDDYEFTMTRDSLEITRKQKSKNIHEQAMCKGRMQNSAHRRRDGPRRRALGMEDMCGWCILAPGHSACREIRYI